MRSSRHRMTIQKDTIRINEISHKYTKRVYIQPCMYLVVVILQTNPQSSDTQSNKQNRTNHTFSY